jgi:hypothetical protein
VVDRFETEGNSIRVALVETLWEGEFFRGWKGWECGFLADENVCVLFDVAVGWIVQADADVLRQVRGKKVSFSDVAKLMCNSSLF